jgi:hypothetical protein
MAAQFLINALPDNGKNDRPSPGCSNFPRGGIAPTLGGLGLGLQEEISELQNGQAGCLRLCGRRPRRRHRAFPGCGNARRSSQS